MWYHATYYEVSPDRQLLHGKDLMDRRRAGVNIARFGAAVTVMPACNFSYGVMVRWPLLSLSTIAIIVIVIVIFDLRFRL